jgi:hypothetical protein
MYVSTFQKKKKSNRAHARRKNPQWCPRPYPLPLPQAVAPLSVLPTGGGARDSKAVEFGRALISARARRCTRKGCSRSRREVAGVGRRQRRYRRRRSAALTRRSSTGDGRRGPCSWRSQSAPSFSHREYHSAAAPTLLHRSTKRGQV